MKRFITENGTAYNFMLGSENAYKEALNLGAGVMYDVEADGREVYDYQLSYFE